MTSVDLSGGCLCGAIGYRIAGAPVFVGQCYCKDCQKATGAGHATVLGVLETQLSIAGEPAVYASQGGSGGQTALLSGMRQPAVHRRGFGRTGAHGSGWHAR